MRKHTQNINPHSFANVYNYIVTHKIFTKEAKYLSLDRGSFIITWFVFLIKHLVRKFAPQYTADKFSAAALNISHA
jgi:hypothetical protein